MADKLTLIAGRDPNSRPRVFESTALGFQRTVREQHPAAFYALGNYAVAQTDTIIVPAPGAGIALYVTDILFTTDTAMNMFLEAGPVVMIPPVYLAIRGGWSGQFQTPIRWILNTAITFTSSAAGNHSVMIMGYTGP